MEQPERKPKGKRKRGIFGEFFPRDEKERKEFELLRLDAIKWIRKQVENGNNYFRIELDKKGNLRTILPFKGDTELVQEGRIVYYKSDTRLISNVMEYLEEHPGAREDL